MWLVVCFVLFGATKISTEFTEEQYYELPRLFYLDDYHECLSRRNGVYCLGTFQIKPSRPLPLFEVIKEYSKQAFAFNRTFVHRGYCVSKCAPLTNATNSNYTSRDAVSANYTALFEHCANSWTNVKGMSAELQTLHYCKRKDFNTYQKPDVAQLIFLVIVAIIIMLNIIGTTYDVRTDDEPKKINLLIAWSIRSNWKILATPYDMREHFRLAPLQGIRVIIAVTVCMSHTAVIYYTMYLYDPRVLEQIVAHPVTMFIQNSTAMLQMFIVLSTFLCTYNLLKYKGDLEYNFLLFLKIIVRRIFRISPVYLLVVGFAATWWTYLSDGPLWPVLVEEDSNVCRSKFWAHAFFVNNLVEPEKICLLPTWYIAVDIQMYIVAVFISLTIGQMRRGVIPTLSLLFIASILMNSALAYMYDWKSLMYFTKITENIRTLFRYIPSFKYLYISPWGNLPACFLGVLLGHTYKYLVDNPIDKEKYKWLLYLIYILCLPILASWVLSGNFIQKIQQPIFVAVYAAIERSVLQILCIVIFFILSIIDSIILKFFAWEGWQSLSRLSLSVMVLHWCVALVIVGESPQPVPVSIINILSNGAASIVFTYVLSLPTTLMVEIPMKRVFAVIAS